MRVVWPPARLGEVTSARLVAEGSKPVRVILLVSFRSAFVFSYSNMVIILI